MGTKANVYSAEIEVDDFEKKRVLKEVIIYANTPQEVYDRIDEEYKNEDPIVIHVEATSFGRLIVDK